MKIDPAEARAAVEWGKKNGLVFDPLACEASKKAAKQKEIDDIVKLDATLKAKRMSIRYIQNKLNGNLKEKDRMEFLEALSKRTEEVIDLERRLGR